jgi:hypothetical protein
VVTFDSLCGGHRQEVRLWQHKRAAHSDASNCTVPVFQLLNHVFGPARGTRPVPAMQRHQRPFVLHTHRTLPNLVRADRPTLFAASRLQRGQASRRASVECEVSRVPQQRTRRGHALCVCVCVDVSTFRARDMKLSGALENETEFVHTAKEHQKELAICNDAVDGITLARARPGFSNMAASASSRFHECAISTIKAWSCTIPVTSHTCPTDLSARWIASRSRVVSTLRRHHGHSSRTGNV